jgi:hypothetical protein
MSMMAHTCNLSYMEGIGRRMKVQTDQGKNARSYLKNN